MRAVNFADFTVSLQNSKNISAKKKQMASLIMLHVNYACKTQIFIFHEIKILTNPQNIYSPQNICAIWYMSHVCTCICKLRNNGYSQ